MTRGEKPEKRRQQRRGIEVRCRVHREGENWYAHILDLSDSGAFIEVDADLEMGSVFELTCYPGKEELRLKCQVRHRGWFLVGFRNAKGVGVEFKDLTEEGRRGILKLLEKARRPAGPKFNLET